MSKNDFIALIKILSKLGYGYPTDKLQNVMQYLGYNPDTFLRDMVEVLGVDGAHKFIGDALKILNDGGKGVKIDLRSYFNTDSWIYLKINNYEIHLSDIDGVLLISYEWGHSRIENPNDGSVKTIDEIHEDLQMGEWDEYEQLIFDIELIAINQIRQKTGITISWI